MKGIKSIALLLLSVLLLFVAFSCASTSKVTGTSESTATTTPSTEATSTTEEAPKEVVNVKYTNIVGYDFRFEFNENSIKVNFIDIYSDDEIGYFISELASVLPAGTIGEYVNSGELLFTTPEAITEEVFNSFVDESMSFMKTVFYQYQTVFYQD